MRRFIKLLSPLLLAALFISCAQSVKQNGSINLDGGKIVSRAVQYSINKSRSPETKAGDEDFTPEMVEAMKEALEFKATLAMEISSEDGGYKKSAEEDYNIDYSSLTSFEKKTIKFNDVPVGIKASINATITTKLAIKDKSALSQLFELMDMPIEEFTDFPDEELTGKLATEFDWGFTLYGNSELTVHEGENPVTLKMTADPNGGGSGEGGEEDIPVDGTIDIEKPVKLTITIDQEKSDSKYYLNNGKIVFTLLDENGNDILEDVDWDAYSDIYGFINQNLLAVDCELYYGHNKINGLLNYGMNYLTMDNDYPLPRGGSYQLSLTIRPGKTSYVNKDGDTVEFPDFEPVTGSFEIEVEDISYFEFDASNLMTIVDPEYQTYGLSDDFLDFIDSLTGDSLIKISGIIPTSYGIAFQPIKNRLKGFIDGQLNEDKVCKYLLDFDFSEMTTTDTTPNAKTAVSCEFQDCKTLRSIILPVDLTKIGYCTFMDCANLEKIVFGSAIESIEDDTALSGCSKLSSVVIPEDAPFEKVGSYTFTGDTSLKTLSLPASFNVLGRSALGSIETLNLADESGTWYYTTDQNLWFKWHSKTEPEIPVITEGSVGELTSLKDFSNFNVEISYPADVTTVSQKLLYAAQNTNYYFYCVK